jgi:hypothetical protein
VNLGDGYGLYQGNYSGICLEKLKKIKENLLHMSDNLLKKIKENLFHNA